MQNKPTTSRTKIWAALMVAGLCMSLPSGAQLGLETLGGVHDRLGPAMGLLEFSVEVTNASNGEVSKRGSNALALVVSPDGLVLANGHMVQENAEPFNIRLTLNPGGEEKTYDVVRLQKPDDINVVLLRIVSDETLNLPHVRFSAGENVRLGSSVALLGLMPKNFDFTRNFTEMRIGAVLEKPRKTYVLDAPVGYGFLGGPALDAEGRVIGVVGRDLSVQEGGELYTRSGHPLLFQASLFQKYIDHPPGEKEDETEREEAYLGVFTQPLTDDFAQYWELPEDGGLIVSTVMINTPAQRMGLVSGDVIVEFDGTPIRAKADREVRGFSKLVQDTEPGKSVVVKVLRAGEAMALKGELGTRPRMSRDAGEYVDEHFGLTVREITADVRIGLNLAEDVQGVIVRNVRAGSIAQLGKMRPGVIVMALNDYPVQNLADFEAAMQRLAEEKVQEVAVFARMGAATGFFRLAPRWDEK
jgi:serine protease Do